MGNFADSRNLRGEDARIDREALRSGRIGPSSPLPSSRKEPASAPKTGKDKGVSSSKKPKKCDEGKSCGATCIYFDDECARGLTGAAATSYPKFLSYVRKYVERGGSEKIALAALERLDSETAASAKRIAKAFQSLERKYPDPKEREERIMAVIGDTLFGMAYKGGPGIRQAYTEEEIKYIKNNKQIDELEKVYRDVKTGKLKTPEEINAALKPIAQQRRVNDISDEQLDLAMAMLPSDVVQALSKQGSPGIWGKWGRNQSSLDLPEGGHTEKNESPNERARLIVRIGLEEGMRNMYTGSKVGFGDVDLEHGIPALLAKAGAEVGSNFGLATRLDNRSKREGSPEEWRQRVLRKYPVDEQGNLTEIGKRKLHQDIDDTRRYNEARSSAMSNSNPQTVASVFAAIDSMDLPSKEKQALKNKAMVSFVGYTETFHQGNRSSRGKNTPERPYLYRGSELASRVLDVAAKRIDELVRSGNEDGVKAILDILRSGASRVNEVLDRELGRQRESVDAANLGSTTANKVRGELIKEIESVG